MVAGGKLPVATPISNGLLEHRYVKSIANLNKKKAVLLHESKSNEEPALLFKIVLIGAGGKNADCIALVSCHARLKRASFTVLWGNLPFKIYADFRIENTVSIYIVEDREGMLFANHTIIKEPYLIDNGNKGMTTLDEINLSGMSLVSAS